MAAPTPRTQRVDEDVFHSSFNTPPSLWPSLCHLHQNAESLGKEAWALPGHWSLMSRHSLSLTHPRGEKGRCQKGGWGAFSEPLAFFHSSKQAGLCVCLHCGFVCLLFKWPPFIARMSTSDRSFLPCNSLRSHNSYWLVLCRNCLKC